MIKLTKHEEVAAKFVAKREALEEEVNKRQEEERKEKKRQEYLKLKAEFEPV